MSNLSRLVRLGLLVPVAFITLAAALVAFVIVYRSWQFETATRDSQKAAIESHVLSESAKIAEEVYLKLDNWAARERQVETYFQGRGAKTTLRFEPPQSNAPPKPATLAMRWEPVSSTREHLIVPLYFSDVFVGTMFVDVTWASVWSFGGSANLAVTLFVPVAAVIALWFLTAMILRKKVFSPLLQRTVQLNRLEAISETTQMIAHDMRKPFHALRLSLQAINSASSAVEVRRIADRLTPMVNKASAEVENMLRDLVDLEKPQNVPAGDVSISAIIEALVEEFQPQRQDQDTVMNVAFGHDHLVLADTFKMQRVLSNLLQNAFQAVNRGGKIWIETSERIRRGPKMEIVVCVGNTGSVIRREDIDKLFDRFFTKGKQNGSGLGLAIAKKFVKGHGGEIWCQSDRVSGTRFYLTIPASSRKEDPPKEKQYPAGDAAALELKVDSNECSEHSGWRHGATDKRSQGSPSIVALVSNDAFFREGLRSLLETIPDPAGIRGRPYSFEEALRSEHELGRSRLVIFDADSESEYSALRPMIQRLSAGTRVYIHSRNPSVLGESIDCARLMTPINAQQVEDLLKESPTSRAR